MLNLPFETNTVIYFAFVSLVLSSGMLLFLVGNRVRRTVKRLRRQYVPHITVPENVFRFVLVFLWISLSFGLLFLAAFIQSYRSFTKTQLVAVVQCRPLEDEEHAMLLELTPVVDGVRQQTAGYVLRGDQWALEGNILKWDDWLNFAGVHTQYKLTRVRGRFVNTSDEINIRPTVYSLVQQEEDPRWQWLFKYGHRLRFVQAVYGNTVFTFPSNDHVFGVYVTTSGFMTKVMQ